MFEGRYLLIATKHQKEKVIAPILEKKLGVQCFISPDFDSDMFGTFSGEIERKEDALITVRNKCLLAMESIGCDLAIANEGSFGPHPSIFFIPADEEILMLIDKKNNLEWMVRELSTETNFSGIKVDSLEALQSFAQKAKFPSHGLIIRRSKDDFSEIVKGITTKKHLLHVFNDFIHRYGTAYVETDMRAMYNPTRMKVIKKACRKLVEVLKIHCPNCGTPGFAVKDVKRGLPCELCHFPTNGIISHFHFCEKCHHSEERTFPKGKKTESAMYCDMCNP